MSERLRIVVLGGLGAMPFAGVAWQVLQYLEGFRRLGHEVLYLEDTARWPYDPQRDTVADDAGPAIAYVARTLARIDQPWAYRDVVTGALHGLSPERLRAAVRSADLLVNLSGVSVLGEELAAVPVRVYLETDPCMPQIEVAQGRAFTIDFLGAHTHHFTYAENLGHPDCGVPPTDFGYLPTRPPIVLDWWSAGPPPAGAAFTTVANWRQTGKDIRFAGELYTWSKHHEFLRILDLPGMVSARLELALAIDDADDIALLRAAGWGVVPAAPLSRDVDAYAAYVRASAGELSVAKDQNVRLRSGWFSDRSACYLAAGRPVVLQDTGFGCAYPTGAGLFAFSSGAQAAEAIAAIGRDPARHAAAAREIAQEHLRAERVLGSLLERAAAPLRVRAAPAR